MMGDNSMGEAPEDLYHHMQVSEMSKENGLGTLPRRINVLLGDKEGLFEI